MYLWKYLKYGKLRELLLQRHNKRINRQYLIKATKNFSNCFNKEKIMKL